MSGQIYNSWKIIEIDKESCKNGVLYWKAKCLECNKVYSVHGANVRNGLSKRCTDCGCGHGHSKQIGQTRTKRTAEESAYHYLFIKLKKDAKKRKHVWELSEQQVKSLVSQNCSYCGIVPSLVCTPLKDQGLSQKREKESTIVRNGIDRIDSSKGYTAENSIPCCAQCNLAKSDFTQAEFSSWFDRLATFQGYVKAK